VKTITVSVNIKPIGAPRQTRADRWKKRKCVTEYHIYRDGLNAAFAKAGVSLADLGSCHRMDWYAEIPLKKSYSKVKCEKLCNRVHTEKPDKDNIEKGIMDSLYRDAPDGIDDKEVACGWTQKTWCRAGSVGKLTVILHFGEIEEFLQ
jgi:Holliday junction resolvase RusA-like endonuclease